MEQSQTRKGAQREAGTETMQTVQDQIDHDRDPPNKDDDKQEVVVVWQRYGQTTCL